MDAELRSYVQEQVAAEAGLPQAWSARLHGETLAEMRSDAHRLAEQLGVAEPRARNERGQFSVDMNRRLRAVRR